MKLPLIGLLFLVTSLHALDKEAILKIASEPHDRTNLLEELIIFPEAREYKVKAQMGRPGETLKPGPEVIAKEKTVRGRYIVSEMKFPGVDNPLVMVVTYDKKTNLYKKWVLDPDGNVSASSGLADGATRTIAWSGGVAGGVDASKFFAIEVHRDEKVTWQEVFFEADRPVWRIEGVAIKTK